MDASKIEDPEIIEECQFPLFSNKTLVNKWEPARRALFNGADFQPRNSRISIMAMEANTLRELQSLVGLECDCSNLAMETGRRIQLMLERICNTGYYQEYFSLPYDYESLKYITAQVDAMPTMLGYDYLPCLDEDARFLLPNKIYNPLDVNELLAPLFRYKINRPRVRVHMIGVGLFLLFFQACMRVTYGSEFRFDLAVRAIMSGLPEDTIRAEMDRIIVQGLV